MADQNNEPTTPEHDPEEELQSELGAVESLQRYIKGPGNRPASNARVVRSEAEIETQEFSHYNATDFLGLDAEVANLLNTAKQAPSQGRPPGEAPWMAAHQASATHAPGSPTPGDEDSQGWLLDLDESTAEAAGKRPVLSDPSREAELARAGDPDASFVEPEEQSERVQRHGLKLLAAAALIGAGLAVWRMMAEDGWLGDQSPETIDFDLARGTSDNGNLPQFGVESERRSLLPDGSWRTVPSGDVAPGMTDPSGGETVTAVEPTPRIVPPVDPAALAESGEVFETGTGAADAEAVAVLDALEALIDPADPASR
jgi:hypothetical protein